MEVVDCHVHLGGGVDKGDVETFLERADLTGVHLFSRDPHGVGDRVRGYIEQAADLQVQLPGKVFAFAWIDPLYEQAPQVVEWAVEECGIVGLKMIPREWYPRDGRARAVYGVASSLELPIQFHAGILWQEGDTSRFCRPAGFETMWDFPRVKFSLAHIGWPWTDECIAVIDKFNIMRPKADQAFVDLTPGTPPVYREEALKRCLAVVGARHMLFGSDSGIPSGEVPTGQWKSDLELLRKLGASDEDVEAIFSGNATRFRSAIVQA